MALAAEDERNNPNVVKAVFEPIGARARQGALFHAPPAPSGPGPLYHHIGLYAYRRRRSKASSQRRNPSLEKRERLEQLRALASGMHVQVAMVDTVPLGVDTASKTRSRARHT